MSLIIPDPRIEAPELFEPGRKPVGPVAVEWLHPLAKGLFFYSIGRDAENLAANRPPSSTIQTPTRITDYISYDSADRHYYDIPDIPSSGRTIATRINPNSLSGSRYIANVHDSIGVVGLIFWQFGSEIRFNWNNAVGYAAASTGLVANEWHTYAGTVESSGNGSSAKLYKDKNELTVTGTGNTVPAALQDTVEVAGRSTNDRDWAGDMSYLAIWSRQLTYAEYLSFYANPYQILIPA